MVLALSRLLPPDGLPSFGGLDICAFHAVTGLPCPGCGLTRAFVALAHGQVHEAWTLHPFAFPLFALCLAGLGAPWLPSPLLTGPRFTRALRRAALALVLALTAFGSVRMLRAVIHPTPQWSPP
ncbi:hypothetical protein GETHLI_34520 [Geothrix limicola]|uniref:DUF2752 domain-containing protein n=1 Tax=Geothrix limicola TaxID=2927978 RepID=A0ABQ5QJA2_9BACT|nr:DUF2752 domain-containing protein [Geothrix limicola]GLH74950.1 hypothetical protein GETHLI_34520 [Geothrix limicola]